MSELIKSVRIRPVQGNQDDLRIGRLDTKISLFTNDDGTRSCTGYSISSSGDELGISWQSIQFQGRRYVNLSNDEIIRDYIRTNTLKERPTEGEFVNIEGNLVTFYQIIQDPFNKVPPSDRSFGSDPYFLTNGCRVFIRWYSVDLSVNYSGRKYGISSNKSYAIDGYIDDARDPLDQSKSIKPNGLVKTVEVFPPGQNDSWVLGDKTDDFISNFVPVYRKDLNDSLRIKYFQDNSYNGDFSKGQDWMILNSLLSAWNKKIPNYNVQLCQPSYLEDTILDYKDPLKQVNDLVTEPEPIVTNNTKVKLKIDFSDNFKVLVREDCPEFRITIGDTDQTGDGFIFSDNDSELIGEEFLEAPFMGDEESVFEEQEYPDEKTRIETQNQSQIINSRPYVPGKYSLDIIPGVFFGNNKIPVRCCQIDGKPVNINIADAVLDMKAAAKRDGINLIVNSGFRPDYNPSINTRSERGVKVSADSQEFLWNKNCAGKTKCSPATAKPGNSKHGSGLAVDFNTGTRTGASGISKMDSERARNYQWLIKNSWRFGFLRTVATEEWHFEYWPELAKRGPYAKLPKTNNLYYADLGINNLQIA